MDEPTGTWTGEPDAHPDPQTADLQTADLQTADPQAADPQTVDPQAARLQAAELERLRTEVGVLRARLDTRRRRAVAVHTLRGVGAAMLVAVTAFSLVSSVVGLWAATTVLNTDRWVATVTPLPKDPRVAAAVAQYTTDEVFRVVDLEQRLRQVLPEPAGFVAAPITGQVRGYVRRTLDTLIRSDRFQRIWVETNRRAHRQVIAALEASSDVVRARDGLIVIDLLPLVSQVLRELSTQLPTLFGHRVDLPDLTGGAIPPRLRGTVQDALGVQLPAHFAQFTVHDDGRLARLRLALVRFKRSLATLVAGTVVTLALALVISPRRRRSLLQLGLWLIVAAVATTVSLRTARAELLSRVPAGTYRDGAEAAITTVTRLLHDRGIQLIWLGAILAAVTYLVGPGRIPSRLRRTAATVAHAGGRGVMGATRAAGDAGPGWIARYRDALRVAGVVAAAVTALTLSSWSGLLAVAAGLATYEVLVTVVAGRVGVAGTQTTVTAQAKATKTTAS